MRRTHLLLAAALLATGLTAATMAPAEAATTRTGEPHRVTVELTGYSWQDNTPPHSSRICCGTVHRRAGGTGTYADPITVAVPGNAGHSMETPAGTRFYAPTLRRYLIVEDSGATKLHRTHLDVWVDGKDLPRRHSDQCMNDITGRTKVIIHPDPGEKVTVGPLTDPNKPGCRI